MAKVCETELEKKVRYGRGSERRLKNTFTIRKGGAVMVEARTKNR